MSAVDVDWTLVGNRAARLRQKRKLSRQDLAARAGVTYQALLMIEKGNGRSLLDQVAAVAEALGTTNTELLQSRGGDQDESTPGEAGVVSGVGE